MANYESKWWGYIYDQMMLEALPDRLESHRRFYHATLQDISGPILECACGTGLILLPLLAAGHNLFGFDISAAMLSTLKNKARAQGFQDIDARVSIQDFETFHYATRFAAIIIPTNTFLMLTTQEAQIRTLKNIFDHLAPSGRLCLDLTLKGIRDLNAEVGGVQGRWHIWNHPETGLPILQRVNGRYDLNNQLVLDQCSIEYEGQFEEFPMTGRWIFKEEFQLLLRLAGFARWEAYGSPAGDPLQVGLEDTNSYWVAYKS